MADLEVRVKAVNEQERQTAVTARFVGTEPVIPHFFQ
jgi:hypothetical protein